MKRLEELRARMAKRKGDEPQAAGSSVAVGSEPQAAPATTRPPSNSLKQTRTMLFKNICSPQLIVPIDVQSLSQKMERLARRSGSRLSEEGSALAATVTKILRDLKEQYSVTLDEGPDGSVVLVGVNHEMVLERNPDAQGLDLGDASGPGSKRKREESVDEALPPAKVQETEGKDTNASSTADFGIDDMLGTQSVKERALAKVGFEIQSLISQPTAKETELTHRFKSKEGSGLREFCEHGTRDTCKEEREKEGKSKDFECKKVHFRRIVQAHTDRKLGDCSYLDACRHMKSCKFVHYEIDQRDYIEDMDKKPEWSGYAARYGHQWVNCDVRAFEMEVLGKFPVIMADPPWDIHMELPYGTMADDEMLNMPLGQLADDGVLFLWVTGRAMELGRKCLDRWGYKCVGEILWVKTNQLQRLIRTGRTGHWINHSKEHCLVGSKGVPPVNHGLDCDVIVAQVRETSRKPDEIYNLLERLCPGQRKLEIFGRPHNTRAGWITLGNQLGTTQLRDPDMKRRMREVYPDVTFVDLPPLQEGQVDLPCQADVAPVPLPLPSKKQ